MKTIHFSARFDNLKMTYHGEIKTDNIDPLPEVRALLKEKCKIWNIDYQSVNEAFIDNPENKKTVNHKDRNKLNNNVDNLEWATNLENMQHAFKNGVFKERDKTTILNIKHMRAKLCQ